MISRPWTDRRDGGDGGGEEDEKRRRPGVCAGPRRDRTEILHDRPEHESGHRSGKESDTACRAEGDPDTDPGLDDE